MKKVSMPYDVQQLDVQKSKNLVTTQSIKLTTAGAKELAKVPNNLHDDLFKKIVDRGPLQQKLVQNSAWLNPINLVTVDPEALQRMFDVQDQE